MSGTVKLCKSCGKRPKTKRSSMYCYFCWLIRQPIELQVEHAQWRLAQCHGEHRARVPKSEWPEGERWCSGCQSFVVTEYVRGSRCRACASQAAHASHVRRTYDISEAEYNQLLAWQSGRCFVCGQKPRSRRLAVDHHHGDGRVRGLLCSSDDHGCNVSLARVLNDASAARRLLDYVEKDPLQRMRDGEQPPLLGVAGA